jgi:DNA topoisomerase-1
MSVQQVAQSSGDVVGTSKAIGRCLSVPCCVGIGLLFAQRICKNPLRILPVRCFRRDKTGPVASGNGPVLIWRRTQPLRAKGQPRSHGTGDQPLRLWLMPHDGVATKSELRKAGVESFPILRSPGGRLRKMVKGKTRPVSEEDARRIERLVIPPGWRNVRISADPRSHIQAVGRDEAGRRQYIYHKEWEAVRSAEKGERLRRLINALPRIRRRIARDLDQPGDLRILATAARLIDRLCLRAGHEEYAGEESGRGAATLLCKHVRVVKDTVELDFPGKGKRRIVTSFADAKVARNIEEARKTRGRRLFKLRSGKSYRNMTANDLNAYLARIAKCDITAKDFRTLRASSLAITKLASNPQKTSTARRRMLAGICREISAVLSNTPAVVRKSYVHSPVVAEYEQGTLLAAPIATRLHGCTQGERLLLAFLQAE